MVIILGKNVVGLHTNHGIGIILIKVITWNLSFIDKVFAGLQTKKYGQYSGNQ